MINIEFKQFPTHVRLSSKKSMKINSQSIYNGKLHAFSRAQAILFMKTEFAKCFPKNLKIDEFPVGMFIELHSPYNYGNVRMSKGIVRWIQMKDEENYIPRNDLDNMIGIWSKVIQDVLVSKGVLTEDTIQYVKQLGYKYIPCKTLDDRKIIVSLIPISHITSTLRSINVNSLSDMELDILNKIMKF